MAQSIVDLNQGRRGEMTQAREIGGIGLTARTAAAAAAVFIPFFAALVYFTSTYFQRRYEEGIAAQQLLLTTRIAADLDQRLRFARDTLEEIASAIGPRQLDVPAEGQRFLDERITLHLLFDEGLRLVSNEGRLLVQSPEVAGARGRDLTRDEAWGAVARAGGAVISKPWGSVLRPGAVAITVAVPVLDARRRPIGQLHGAVRVDGGNIAGDLAKISIGKAGYFVIVTRDRVRVSHPDPARVLKLVPPGVNAAVDRALDAGFEGVLETTSTTGQEMLAAVRRLGAVDWFVFGNMPLEEVRAPFRASLPAYGGAAALGLVLLTIAVWASLRRATRPLVQMTEGIERIAAAPAAGLRIGAGAGAGEVARLASSFDRLLEALDAREADQRRAEEDRRRLEERLQAQQRLDSLGVLAGGIAHDFNNLLTPVIANATLAMQDLPPGHALRADMQEIVTAARRGAELARRILAFSRRQVLETQVVDLNAELRSLEKTLRAVVGEAVELRVEPASVAARVRADPTQLQQAILNLATNAREAMPGGGRLTLSVAVPGLDGRTPWVARRRPEGRYARITVADTGIGIDAATLPRIFEPFFTTKGAAKRTGLGLATVHGTLLQHGGDVEVSSTPGVGTTFRLYLPLEAEVCAAAGAEPPAAPQVHLRIVLVEDEPTVRALAGRILRRAGHDVTVAASPAEALALPDDTPPDLLVSDVMLPEIDGIELHRRLAQRWPGLRVLFMSGFPGGHARLEEAIARGEHFLQKPFGPSELLERVRAAAEGAPIT
ncbi:MAG TPA: ATP-binding protein [Anaeromyxobacteraceae bacterium]|nr:ATP-binding protein [Anaeromyxobacteraceae bacterium]